MTHSTYGGQPNAVNGITKLVRYHHTRSTRGTLTPENLLELDPRKDQLGMGHITSFARSKNQGVVVDKQNRINTEKTLGYDKSHEEARDTMHPDPQINIEPSTKSQKRGTVVTSEKEKDTPPAVTCLTGICQAHCQPFS